MYHKIRLQLHLHVQLYLLPKSSLIFKLKRIFQNCIKCSINMGLILGSNPDTRNKFSFHSSTTANTNYLTIISETKIIMMECQRLRHQSMHIRYVQLARCVRHAHRWDTPDSFSMRQAKVVVNLHCRRLHLNPVSIVHVIELRGCVRLYIG